MTKRRVYTGDPEIDTIIGQWRKFNYVEDRMEYCREDLQSSHPELSNEQIERLYRWLHV